MTLKLYVDSDITSTYVKVEVGINIIGRLKCVYVRMFVVIKLSYALFQFIFSEMGR
jgi:hypothetical protein